MGMMSDLLLESGPDFLDPDFASTASVPATNPIQRLRLCFIAETVHAGVGRHLVDSITGLCERGHEVHLIHSPTRTDPQFLSALKSLANVRCYAVPMPRAIGPKDLPALKRILRYVREQGPFDIIHGHSSKGGGYARLLKLFGYGPVLYSPHAFITMSPLLSRSKRSLYRSLEWLLAGLSDRVICTSLAERDHAADLRLPQDRLSLIINGNAPAPAPPRELVRRQLGIEAHQVVLGFAGRMEDQKRPSVSSRRPRAFCRACPNVVLVMIGSGPKLQSLQDSVRGLSFEHRIRWLGTVEARQFLPGFDVFLLPSRYEGAPMCCSRRSVQGFLSSARRRWHARSHRQWRERLSRAA